MLHSLSGKSTTDRFEATHTPKQYVDNGCVQVHYEAPRTIAEAIAFLHAHPDASVLAGGTDLLIQFRAGSKKPSAFVDIKRIPDLVGIRIDNAGLRLGAGTSAAEIGEHAELRRLWPGIAEAVALIGSVQIQGRGTVGGNFCNASPAADTPCAFIVNRAECVVAGPEGGRRIPAGHFVVAPGKTALKPGEFLVALEVPRPAPRSADAYLRLIPRTEMDIAVAGAAVSVTLDADGICTDARVALAAVAPTPIVVDEASRALVGTIFDAPALERAAAAASAAAQPIADKRGTIAYRRTVAGVLTRRAALIALTRTKEH
jgi:carbon-monoxide dehydrogenase medium subunit